MNAGRTLLERASVSADVLALRPDYTALLVVAEGLTPGPSDAPGEEALVTAERSALEALAGRPPEELPEVAAWRDAYRAFGAKPQRTRPSVEALLRRVGSGLPRVNRLTDLYNAVSVTHLVPVGGEDLAAYAGAPALVRASGDEPFETTAGGEAAVEHPRPGEVVWRDDAGVTCRIWNWRQCTRTRITDETTDALFVLDGLGALGPDRLQAAADDLVARLVRVDPRARVAVRTLRADP